MAEKPLTFSNMKTMDPEELTERLIREFYIAVPEEVDSVETMSLAGNLLGELTNNYSYLSSMLALFKVAVRVAKKKKDKELTEDMISKRDTLEVILDMVKQQYAAVSRMLSTRQMVINELRMNEGE